MNKNLVKQTPLQELDFTYLDEKLFERFCVRLFANEFPNLEEDRLYGKKGMKQHGIDFYGYNYDTNKYVVGQCKNYVKIQSATEIHKIVDLFLKGEFLTKTERFILATSYSLSDKNEQENVLDEVRIKLNKHNIKFTTWDKNGLNTTLKKNRNNAQLVFEFFDGGDVENIVTNFYGRSISSELKKRFKPKSYSFPENYIPRYLSAIQLSNPKENDFTDNKPTLLDALKVNSKRKKIILRSDAGLGKTTELEYIAGYYSKKSKQFLPILKYLKNYTIQTLEEILSNEIDSWKNIDYRNVLLILDGLDELKIEEREQFLKNVERFIIDNEECNILISCRTNFIDSLPLQDFDIWELEEFDIENVKNYANKILNDDTETNLFLEKIHKLDIVQWLRNPFILSKILEIYQETPNNLPRNRKELLNQVTHLYLKKDKLKGSFLAENEQIIISYLRKLALCMNLYGANSLPYKKFNVLFTNHNDREIIRKSSLINSNDGIKFTHNIFQEYYSACELAEYDFQKITSYICFKPTFNRIKPKWYNTIAILFDLLPKENKFYELLSLIVENQPSLLFQIEYKEIDINVRFDAFVSILNNPNRIYNNEIFYTPKLADFGGIKENGKTINYLLDCIEKSDEVYLTELFYMLREVNKNRLFGCRERIIKVSKNIVIENIDKSTPAIETLYKFKILTEELAEFIFNNVKDSKDFSLRSITYKYLNALKLNNKYVDFYIEGIQLYVKNERSNHYIAGTEDSLVAGISKITESNALHKLLDYLITHHKNNRYDHQLDKLYDYTFWVLDDESFEDEDYYSYNKTRTEKHFSEELAINIVRRYPNDNTLFDKYLEFYIYVNDYHNRVRIQEFATFFHQLGLTHKAFWGILKEMVNFASWEKIACIISDDLVIPLVEKYSKDELDAKSMWACIQSFNMAGKKEIAEKFRLLLNEVGKEKFEYHIMLDYDLINKQKHQKDLILLLNKNEFVEKVKEIFDYYNTNELNQEQIFAYRKNWEEVDNNVVVNFISNFNGNEPVEKNSILNYLENDYNWAWLVVWKCRIILQNDKELLQSNIDFITKWCQNNIESCNFSNAIWTTKNSNDSKTYHVRNLESYVSFFFKKLDIPLPENKILKMLQFDLWSNFDDGKDKKSLTEIIIEKVEDIEKVKEQILLDFQETNLLDEIILHHVKICEKYFFIEAKPFIKQILIEQKVSDSSDLGRILKSYLLLGGKIDDLEFIFDTEIFDIKNEYHLLLLENFAEDEGYKDSILNLLDNSNIDSSVISYEIIIKVIELLVKLGSYSGLELLKKQVISDNVSLDRHFALKDVENIHINKSLPILVEILEHILQKYAPNPSPFRDEATVIFEIFWKVGLYKDKEENYTLTKTKLEEICNKYSTHSLHYYMKSRIIELEKEHYLRIVDFKEFKDVMHFYNQISLN